MSTEPKSKKTSLLERLIFISSSKTVLKEPVLQDSVIYAFIVVHELILPLLDKLNFRELPLNKSMFCDVGSFCLNISISTMDVQKEGIIKVWVPSHQEANSPQGN